MAGAPEHKAEGMGRKAQERQVRRARDIGIIAEGKWQRAEEQKGMGQRAESRG